MADIIVGTAQTSTPNLTGIQPVYDGVAAANIEVEFSIAVGDGTYPLASPASTLSFTVTNDSQVIGGATQNIAKAAGVTRASYRTQPIFVAATKTLLVTLESDGDDTQVYVSVTPRVRAVDAVRISGGLTAGSNLKSACDNYSAARGLTGTALPAVAADGAGGLPTTTKITDARLGALTDLIDGGRLDLIFDIIAADTTTDIPALIGTAQADLDVITGATGVNLLTATQASIDAIETDTDELQTDWADGGRLDLILDTAASTKNITTETTIIESE